MWSRRAEGKVSADRGPTPVPGGDQPSLGESNSVSSSSSLGDLGRNLGGVGRPATWESPRLRTRECGLLCEVFAHQSSELLKVLHALNLIAERGEVGEELGEVTGHAGKSFQREMVAVKVELTFDELQ